MKTFSTKPNRAAWRLAAVVAVVVLGGIGPLGWGLRDYWIARYRGKAADLSDAVLILAPLAGARLEGANLRGANLRGANLSRAVLDDYEVPQKVAIGRQNFIILK